MSAVNNTKKQVDATLRKAYVAPVLVTYGAVADLTASGSGAKKEGTNGGGNCDKAPIKAHC